MLRGRNALASFGAALVAALTWVAPCPTQASPFGTTYTGTASNFPGSDTAVLFFDGLDEPLGASGLVVGESATNFGAVELLEFSLRTADGNPFVGQQDDALHEPRRALESPDQRRCDWRSREISLRSLSKGK